MVDVISRGQARRKRARLLRDIADLAPAAASLASAMVSLRLAVSRYLRSDTVRLSALCDALDQSPSCGIAELARLLDPFASCEEPVHYFLKPKSSGRGWRTVCSFPTDLKVRHALIKDVVETAYGVPAEQYLAAGRGHGAAVMSLCAAIGDGRPYVLTADIRSAFASVNVDALYQLDVLPTEVIRNALDHRHLNLTPKGGDAPGCRNALMGNGIVRHCYNMIAMSAPTGLLEGSIASNALFSWLLRDIGECAPSGSTIVMFSDNIAIACPSEEARREAMGNLTSFAACHGSGPFTLKTEVCTLRDGFTFLGHAIGQYSRWSALTVEPSLANFEKLLARAQSMEADQALRLVASEDHALREAIRLLRPFSGIRPAFAENLADELVMIAQTKFA